MKLETEAKIQQDCYVWFNNNYCLEKHENRSIMFSVPNENIGSQQRKVNTGLLRGVSDTIIIHKGICMFVEFKTVTGVISVYQKEFKSRLEMQGYKYYIVRSLEQFKQLINEIPTTNLHN
jgi:hypothetical protein